MSCGHAQQKWDKCDRQVEVYSTVANREISFIYRCGIPGVYQSTGRESICFSRSASTCICPPSPFSQDNIHKYPQHGRVARVKKGSKLVHFGKGILLDNFAINCRGFPPIAKLYASREGQHHPANSAEEPPWLRVASVVLFLFCCLCLFYLCCC